MVFKIRLLWIFLFVITLSACGSTNDDDTNESKTSKWHKDIEYFERTLENNHPDLFWNKPKEQYQRQIDQLYNAVPEMEEYEIVLELARITSMMANHKDDHTAIWVWSMTKYLQYFPIWVKWFSDGVYAVDVDPIYTQILGRKLVKIENTAIDDVLEAVSDYISRGNDMWLMEMAPKYIIAPELLYKLGITQNRMSATFHFEDASGAPVSVDVTAMAATPAVYYDRHPGSSANIDLPAYRRNVEKNYWFEYLPEDKTVYVAYNDCSDMAEQTFEQFTDQVVAFMDEHETNKIILDLRNNYGGDSEVIYPLNNVLVRHPHLNAEGNLFVVIGRGTFSSGTMACETITYATDKAIFVGEPTGGLVSNGTYGGISGSFSLPLSGLNVSCSGQYFDNFQQAVSTASFIPDIDISLSSVDYFAGKDPVMEYILQQ